MQYAILGNTGISVSKICYGSLTLGPLQKNLPLDEGAELLAYAFSKGVNFVDTAQLYDTYGYIKAAMARSGKYDIVISTKTYAYTSKDAETAFEDARRQLDRDVIDIFMLHEQESLLTLKGHREALDFLYTQKAKGRIKAVGASMHHVGAVLGACALGLDIVHPLYNFKGLGIADGTAAEMKTAIAKAAEKGIGVFSMKSLGGGNLISETTQAFDFVRSDRNVSSVAVGMQSFDEIDANIAYFETGRIDPALAVKLSRKKRTLHIDDWCAGCGECVNRCKSGALTIIDGKARCDMSKCVLCSYCAAACELFAIKVL